MPRHAIQKHPPLEGLQRPNQIITPNQFFDVCLPHCSTPAIRLISFILHETLGYTNDDGDPFQERFRFSQKQIASEAGLAPSSVKKALDEAVAGRFLRCTRVATPACKGQAAKSAEYEVRWHEYPDGAYVVDPRKFQGFFADVGNRTAIPEEFFSHVVRYNPKSVIRFVGMVIRKTLGFKASHGKGRVTRAELSYSRLQQALNLGPHAIADAIKRATDMHYVQRLQEGVFDPSGQDSRGAIYTVRWCQPVPNLSTPKSAVGSKLLDHTKKRSGTAPKSAAAIHTKKRSNLKRFPKGNLNKQQEAVVAESSFEGSDIIQKLCAFGFQRRDAEHLASHHPAERIQAQLAWLPQRYKNPRNPLGLLRRAIEEDWTSPSAFSEPQTISLEAKAFAKGFYAGRWNADSSASEPSRSDLQAAERLVHHLAKIHGQRDIEQAAIWGRGFGRHFGQAYPTLTPSLGYAGSVLADDLIRSHQRQVDSKRLREQLDLTTASTKPSTTSSTTADSTEKHAWLDYLASQETTLRERFPGIYAAFEQSREAHRANVQRSGLPHFSESMRAFLDQRATRLTDLQKAFPEELPDFEHWQRHPILST